jgi:hypothetical protein
MRVKAKNAGVVDRPDVLLSLTANRFGAGGVLVAGGRGLPLGVHAGVSLRGDLRGKGGDDPYGVWVTEGIGSGARLVSAPSLDWHDF